MNKIGKEIIIYIFIVLFLYLTYEYLLPITSSFHPILSIFPTLFSGIICLSIANIGSKKLKYQNNYLTLSNSFLGVGFIELASFSLMLLDLVFFKQDLLLNSILQVSTYEFISLYYCYFSFNSILSEENNNIVEQTKLKKFISIILAAQLIFIFYTIAYLLEGHYSNTTINHLFKILCIFFLSISFLINFGKSIITSETTFSNAINISCLAFIASIYLTSNFLNLLPVTIKLIIYICLYLSLKKFNFDNLSLFKSKEKEEFKHSKIKVTHKIFIFVMFVFIFSISFLCTSIYFTLKKEFLLVEQKKIDQELVLNTFNLKREINNIESDINFLELELKIKSNIKELSNLASTLDNFYRNLIYDNKPYLRAYLIDEQLQPTLISHDPITSSTNSQYRKTHKLDTLYVNDFITYLRSEFGNHDKIFTNNLETTYVSSDFLINEKIYGVILVYDMKPLYQKITEESNYGYKVLFKDTPILKSNQIPIVKKEETEDYFTLKSCLIENSNYCIYSFEKKEKLMKIPTNIIKVTSWTLFILFPMLLLLIILISQKITIPLKNLSNAIISFKSGNQNYDLSIESNDEIGFVTHSFINMQHNIIEKQMILSESLLKQKIIVDTISDVVIVTNEKCQIISSNKAIYKTFKYSTNELINKEVTILLDIDKRSIYKKEILDYIPGHHSEIIGQKTETVGMKKGGETLPIEVSISELTFQGKIMFVFVINDISERKKHEQKLKRDIEDIKKYSEQKSDLITTIAHEIKNPITQMLEKIKVLYNYEKDQEQKNIISDLDNNATLLSNKLSKILEHDEIKKEEIPITEFDFDLEDLCYKSCLLFKNITANENIILLLDYPQEIPSMMYGDGNRVKQIVSHLLSNAIKKTKNKGEIIVTVKLEKTKIIIEVHDSGPGIDSEKNLFEYNPNSTQIGLPLCKKITSALKGEIGYYNKQNGCCFWVKLPIYSYTKLQKKYDRILEDKKLLLLISNSKLMEILKRNLIFLGANVIPIKSMKQLFEYEKTDRIDFAITECVFDGHFLAEFVDLIKNKKCSFLTISTKEQEQEFKVDILTTFSNQFLYNIIKEKLLHIEDEPNAIVNSKSETQNLENKRILLVEDTKINQDIALAMLKKHNMTAIIAENGKIATELCLSDNFDAILMDCFMPILNGYDASRNIRENGLNKETPIIALTANVADDAKEVCLAAGMNDYLAKPFKHTELIEKLSYWIRISSQKVNETSITEISEIDLEQFESVREIMQDSFHEYVEKFISSVEDKFEKISTYVANGDKKSLTITLHSLKSDFATFGIKDIALKLNELEHASDPLSEENILAINLINQKFTNSYKHIILELSNQKHD